MPTNTGSSGPRRGWRDLIRRGRAFALAAATRLRRAIAGAVGAARRAARRYAPAAGERIVRASDRIERVARAAWSWLRALPRRSRALAARLGLDRRHAWLAATLLLLGGWLLWERCGVRGCPDVDRLASYQPGGAAVVLDRHGEHFADLAPVEHETVPLDSLPPWVAAAFVAVEDKRFFEHYGVDWWRVLGALWADVRAGGYVEGSSTIPMQLSRNLFPDRIRAQQKTLRRKLLEMRMAGEIERRFSKAEILELYLNHIYFGGGAYGIQAAARLYFGKQATELEVHEAALLAALPKAPAHYDPRRRPDAARSRRDLVLLLMEQQERIPFREAHAARQRDLGVAEDSRLDADGDLLAPYFVQQVRRFLEDRLGEDLYAEPLRIVTTLDPIAQRAAEEELERQLARVEQGWYGRFSAPRGDGGAAGARELQGAVVLMDAGAGDVLAWVGGRDFDTSRFDRARLGRRQAGSAFKPFVYAAALEQGLPPSQPILDEPYRYASGGGPVWEPRNYSGWFEGRMSMREALVRSQNVPAARLAAATGADAIADLARRVGIRGEVPGTPVAALGVTALSPLEMTAAYSAFATLGRRAEPRFVLRVERPDGRLLWTSQPRTHEVLDPAVAFLLTDMLRDAVDWGTGTAVRHAGVRGPVAGKTGTTSDATDVWFVGYTPRLVGTVWVGFDQVRPVARGATGGGIAAPVWGRVVARLDAERTPPAEWEAPAGIVTRWVDPESGRVLQEGCSPLWDSARRELFLAGREPRTICPWRAGDDWYGGASRWFGRVWGSRGRAPDSGDPDPNLGAPRVLPAPTSDPQAAAGATDGR